MEGRGEESPRPHPLSTITNHHSLSCRAIGNAYYSVSVSVCTDICVWGGGGRREEGGRGEEEGGGGGRRQCVL